MAHLHLDCTAGISGDMFVAALLDLGWSGQSLRKSLKQLGLPEEIHFHTHRVRRGSVDSLKFEVHSHAKEHSCQSPHAHRHHHHEDPEHLHAEVHPDTHGEVSHSHGRCWKEIRQLLLRSGLEPEVRDRAVAVFGRIAVAEGKIHGVPPEDVHFHEVGCVDSIVDIVAACAAVHALGIRSISASVPVEGTGVVRCAHGVFPIPAPATLEILRGIPLRQVNQEGERITPTGAALLAEFASSFGSMPEMCIEKIGYGAGSRDPVTHPNVLRAILGQPVGAQHAAPDGTPQRVVEVRCNLDDCSPEVMASVAEGLRRGGALDVHFLPCQMKKNRPGHVLVVLAEQKHLESISRCILRETTAFGLRWQLCERLCLERSFAEVQTVHGSIRIKLGKLDGKIVQAVPEFADCEALARQHSVPVLRVYRAAESAALQFLQS